MTFDKQYAIRWADLDPNGHLRHSAYNDYATQVRVDYLVELGFPLSWFAQQAMGPVIFREDARFRREIGPNETIRVDAQLGGLSADGGRWRYVHTIYSQAGRESATISVEGAWLDLRTRKLTQPPAQLLAALRQLAPHATYAELSPRLGAAGDPV